MGCYVAAMTLLSAVVMLFFVMDPLGNIPLYLSALRDVDPARRKLVVARELLIALVILLSFLFIGTTLLSALHVSQAALTAAGGIVLLMIAIRMVFPSETKSLREEVQAEPFVFPLAVPYVAGPSVMATEMLLMSRERAKALKLEPLRRPGEDVDARGRGTAVHLAVETFEKPENERAIDDQISRLRKMIEPDPSQPRYIQTVWGVGYVFVPDGTS